VLCDDAGYDAAAAAADDDDDDDDVQWDESVDVTDADEVNKLIDANSVDFLDYIAWDQVW